MCRPNNNSTSTANIKRNTSRLLLTHDSFVIPELPNKDDENKHSNSTTKKNPHIHGLGGPTVAPTLLTVAFYVGLLFIIEHATRLVIAQYEYIDPEILGIELNRQILARHIAVDFFSLLACAYIAITNRHACSEMMENGWARLNGKKALLKPDSMHEDGFEERIFKYHPGSQRLLMIFFVYQVKNMYDTIVWEDGIAFVLHHLFAGAAAWAGLFPGQCHFYALFYFGYSEISTAILTLLANFDPEVGVIGLEKIFPKTKIVLGTLFVTSFIICRVIMWPFTTYYFARDVLKAIRSDLPQVEGRKGTLYLLLVCCACLSAIQFVFVAMIVQIGKQEIPLMIESLFPKSS